MIFSFILICVEFVLFLESLRNVVIAQEAKIKDLEARVDSLTEEKKRCERHRKREGKFLESVISKCKGDNVPLTDNSCSEKCKLNKVTIASQVVGRTFLCQGVFR